MHALKLYHELGGIITRRELEKTALKTHGISAEPPSRLKDKSVVEKLQKKV